MALASTQIPAVDKDPMALKDYGFDLSLPTRPFGTAWLAPGETLSSLTVTADAGITVASSSIGNNAAGLPTVAIAWISGGTIGSTYYVRFTFTTNQGRTDTRSILFRVVQC
jgi:hypothetical protein